jgi:putative nucleotidyltransferase with HDIG domain
MLGSFFDGFSSSASPIWPAIGFAILFTHYDKNSKYPVIIALILGNAFGQIFIVSNNFEDTIFLVFSFSSASILEVVLFPTILKLVKKLFRNEKNYLWFFLIDFLIIAFIGAVVVYILFSIRFNQSVGMDILASWFIGDFFGMLIFTSIGLYSMTYDDNITRKSIISNIVILSIFTLILGLLFTHSSIYEDRIELSILLIPVFIFGTVYINYRVLAYLSLVYIGLYQVLYIPNIGNIELLDFILSLNVTLVLLVTMSIALRDRMVELKISDNEKEKTSTKLNNVLTSITNLFAFRTSIDQLNLDFNEEYLEKVFDLAISIFDNFDGASCYFEKGDFVRFIKTVDYDIQLLNDSNILTANFNFEVNSPIYITDAEDSIKAKTKEKYQEYQQSTKPIRESIYVGFYLGQNLRGGMSFDKYISNGTSFTDEDIAAFTYFQTTVNHLFQETYSLAEEITIKDSLLVGLVRALEVYDPHTKGHSEEVAKLSNLLAKKCNLSNSEVVEITYAGLLHDIGKIGISQHIINKTSRLQDDEYEVVKGHSKQGFDIIHSLVGMETISDMVLNHHERWDGLGYPNNLTESNISLGSQIIGVADAVSTMLSGRPYAKRKSIQEVLTELKRCKGTQFSPDIADEMIEILLSPEFEL